MFPAPPDPLGITDKIMEKPEYFYCYSVPDGACGHHHKTLQGAFLCNEKRTQRIKSDPHKREGSFNTRRVYDNLGNKYYMFAGKYYREGMLEGFGKVRSSDGMPG